MAKAPGWLVPVAVIFTLQTTTAFLMRFIPIIAPAIALDYGWKGSSTGYLTAMATVGGLLVLAAGSGIMRQVGGIRMLQLTMLVGAASMSLFLLPSLTIALCGCFIMGLSGGVTTPAGSEVLQRFSPPEKRNLIFSIKQAGVPLGGVMAGLAIPAVVAFAGWRAALYATAGMVMLVTLLTWRLTAGFDRVVPGQGGWAWPTLASLRMLAVPLRSLRHSAGLMKISVVGSLFAVSQSCWFTFTVVYLVDRLDFSLGKAGLIFSIMQAGGVAGRITLGWVADHFNSTTAALAIAALVSSGTTIILGLITQDWSFGAIVVLALVAGCSAASWNGVQMAEVARRSPADMVAETAAGAGMLVNLANMITPTLFAAYVAATGRYDLAFAFAGACSLLVVVFLPRDEARR